MLVRLLLLTSIFSLYAKAQAVPPPATSPRIIHVFVALADNKSQGIVPVPAHLGNGDDPARNLYWGAAYGVKTYFSRSRDWTRLECRKGPKPAILERCVFKRSGAEVYLIADAYQGKAIKESTLDFFHAAAGAPSEPHSLKIDSSEMSIFGGGHANLVAYVGHNGLMDFQFAPVNKQNDKPRDVIILACASKQYFSTAVRASGASPILWTTNLMAPEAYVLKTAIDGWIGKETHSQIRERAAVAYDKYQKCGIKGARRLFAAGW